MFEQAERFTRTTVLPLVSSITPRFFTDIFAPRPPSRYIPFTSEESTEKNTVKLDLDETSRHEKNRMFNPPPTSKRSRRRSRKNFRSTTESDIDSKKEKKLSETKSNKNITEEVVTPYSNIQKIPRKKSTKKTHKNR